ncbi:acyl--CoA ligase [Gordonia sp. HY002]|uniref:class I adenylate-forming enzyme family protein n=1 Tax=Gordonia zhenghanii TaxID=2911516 RepID=UPI001EF061C4|nr:class I adenylate-forming enzyme family protein [Gordonia zhenghanii]MCF8571521.1 acyl--CoA ligase [Gordonia zhenghanii]MCF8605742.1 acyl--CoA ligase [Gordonia zhenghanii]
MRTRRIATAGASTLTETVPDIASVMGAYREIERSLTGPGAPYEMTTILVRNEPCRTYTHAETSLYDVFAGFREGNDDRLLATDGTNSYTYAQIFGAADTLARVLRHDLGVAVGDHVGIAMSNRPASIIGLLAALRAGAVAVMYNARSTVYELTDTTSDVPSKVTIVDEKRESLVRTADPATVVISTNPSLPGSHSLDDLLVRTPADIEWPVVEPDQVALVLFTSGTSARAKGVQLTHRGMGNVVLNMRFVADTNLTFAAKTYGIDIDDLRGMMPQINSLLIFPLFHVSGLAGLAASMVTGGCVVTMERWDPNRAADLISGYQVSMASGPPMVVSDLLAVDDAADRLASLVNVVPGGQATPPSVYARVGRTLPNSRRSSGWGMTEVGGSVCTAGGDILAVAAETAGPMSPTMDVRVVDDGGVDLPSGAVGELLLRGGLLMSGYHGRPDETADAFDGAWFKTGDVGYVDEHGLVYLVDRKKDLVISRGENISCVEVETVLVDSDRIVEAGVFGVSDPRLGERLVAAVVPAAADVDTDEVKAIVAARLNTTKVPDEVVLRTDPLPRNATGKLLKRVLRQEHTDASSSR